MATEKRVHSDLAIPPGEYLAEVLDARHMSQAELARRTGRPVQAINEIIKGDKALTPETALQLESALGVPAHIWTGLENRFRLARARSEENELMRKEISRVPARLYKRLADGGYVKRTGESEHKVRELHRFYGVSALENMPKTRTYGPFFQGKEKGDEPGFAMAAWLRCAELRADEVPTEAFSGAKLKGAMDEIRTVAWRGPNKTALSRLKAILSRCGVALVSVSGFPDVAASGVVFWPRADKAVILMDLERISADRFAPLLFHSLGRLLLHKKTTFAADLEAVEKRAGEPLVRFEDVVKKLKGDGKLTSDRGKRTKGA
jgi:HTH-type transcriptional regulator/antitoxin HigA